MKVMERQYYFVMQRYCQNPKFHTLISENFNNKHSISGNPKLNFDFSYTLR